jgi:hypothetical protein
MPVPFGRANEALRKLKTLVAPSATSLQTPGDDPPQTEFYGCSTSPAECVSRSALSAARRAIDPEASPPRSGLQGRAVHHTYAPPGNSLCRVHLAIIPPIGRPVGNEVERLYVEFGYSGHNARPSNRLLDNKHRIERNYLHDRAHRGSDGNNASLPP